MRRVGKGFSGVLDKCSTLVLRVEGLETANAAQQLEIIKLKARVKKLERLNKIKSLKLRRLKKVGTSQRVESSKDEENVFNQGRISVDMDQDKGVKLVVDQEKDVEVLSVQEDTEVQEVIEVVTTAKLITEVVTAAATQVAATSTPAKKLQEELEKEHEEVYKQIDWNAAFDHVQAKETQFDANMKFLFKSKKEIEKEDEEIIKSINETPAQKAEKRRKLSEEAQEADNLRGRLEIVQDEDDDVFVEAIPHAQKVPVVDYQLHNFAKEL
nr:hypothetical protein [Tanacetum cinerariifolium]